MRSKPVNPRLIALIVAVAMFMATLDSTIIATAMPRMAEDFGVSPVGLSIGITVYIMVSAVFLPISSWVADRFGTRRVFVIAIFGFTIASVLCGLSESLTQFALARALQAIFASLMVPVGNLLLLRTTPKADLVSVMAISTTPALIAPVIGPPIGGFITTFLSWPWIFYLNVPIGLAGVLLALRYIPNLTAESEKPFDTKGFVITGSALTAFIYGLDRLGAQAVGWQGPAVLIAAGLILGVLAVRHSRRIAYPLVSLKALRFQTFTAATITGGSLIKIPFMAQAFILPLLFQVGFGLSAFQSGLLLLAQNAGDLVLKTIASQALRWIGFRFALVSGALLTAAATAACALLTASMPLWFLFTVLFISGMCRSVLFTGMMALTFADVPSDEMGDATVLSNVGNSIVAALGISLSAIAMNLSLSLSGNESLTADDCRIALIAMAAIGATSVFSFMRLPRDAGAEVSGHRLASAGSSGHSA